ncbi:MAG TPA: c-type cytochrome [Pedobacter sp.]|jgi:cytochrome c
MIMCAAAFVTACGNNANNSTSTTGDTVAATDQTIAARQTEVDTSLNNIGTDRTVEGAEVSSNATPAAKPKEEATKKSKQASVPNDNQKGAKLIAGSDCLACHKEKDKLVGPAYVEVAKKYKDTEADINYLAGKVIKGGAGVWGQVPMSPHPALSESDAREMVKYILSLN